MSEQKPKLPEVRSMTRGQVKSLKAEGLDPAFTPRMIVGDPASELAQVERNDKMVDWILDNVYEGIDLSAFGNAELIVLARKTYEAAYGAEAKEVKN